MSFSGGKLLLGFVFIAALVIIAGSLGAAKDVITKDEMPDFNDDLKVLNWLCAHSEEILQYTSDTYTSANNTERRRTLSNVDYKEDLLGNSYFL
ncbi:MAG: hypothetical protein J7K58_03315 [Euryarchaeota archaeon]|nr:hypothetical protein [Euryarchaeota archaeon]